VLTVLINALGALPTDVVLVLDDYHLIETQAIHEALAFLLDHLPPRLHLLIATRADPALPLARPRAQPGTGKLPAPPGLLRAYIFSEMATARPSVSNVVVTGVVPSTMVWVRCCPAAS